MNLTGEATDDGVIVRSTIDLGHNMGLKVVAEGVEGAEGYELLDEGVAVGTPRPCAGVERSAPRRVTDDDRPSRPRSR